MCENSGDGQTPPNGPTAAKKRKSEETNRRLRNQECLTDTLYVNLKNFYRAVNHTPIVFINFTCVKITVEKLLSSFFL